MAEQKFTYRARTTKGEMVNAELVAASEVAAIALLRGRGYIPLEVKAIQQSVASRPLELKIPGLEDKGPVKTKEMVILCRQLAAMFKAGVVLIEALETVGGQQRCKKLKNILNETQQQIRKGSTFSEALKKHTQKLGLFFVNMVKVGESVGQLDQVFERLNTHYQKEMALQQKVKSAMVYPTILTVVCILVVSSIMIFVLPSFAETFARQDKELPLITQILMGSGVFLQQNLVVILVSLGIAGFATKKFARSPAGREFFDGLKLKIPVIKDVQQKALVARFCRSLNTTLSSGMVLTEALAISRKVAGNVVFEKQLEEIESKIRKGRHFAELIAANPLFPPFLVQMATVGERSGMMDEMMQKTAEFYDEEVKYDVERATALIEPALLIVMGVVVGGIVMAVMLPIFSSYQM